MVEQALTEIPLWVSLLGFACGLGGLGLLVWIRKSNFFLILAYIAAAALVYLFLLKGWI